MPRYQDLGWSGLEEFTPDKFNEVMSIDRAAWMEEVISHQDLFVQLYDKLPKEFVFERELLLSSLFRSPDIWGENSTEGC